MREIAIVFFIGGVLIGGATMLFIKERVYSGECKDKGGVAVKTLSGLECVKVENIQIN